MIITLDPQTHWRRWTIGVYVYALLCVYAYDIVGN